MDKEFKEKGSYRKYFYLAFSIAFIIAIILLFTISVNRRKAAYKNLQTHENEIINIESEELIRDLSGVLSDLKYLKNAFSSSLINPSDIDEIALNWREFSKQRKIYDQIRFIDSHGMEKIRINRKVDESYIVDAKDLQDKCGRYYFDKTIILNDGDYFISPLDLNVEDGIVEDPYKPVIRLSTPVFDDSGNVQGIVIINYLASDVLKLFRKSADSSLFSMFLINSDGYYLSSDDPSKEWGFMFDEGEKNNFKEEFPSEWDQLNSGTKEIINDNGIFFANKIELQKEFTVGVNSKISIDKSDWFIVSYIPRVVENTYYFTDNKGAMIWDIIKTNLFLFFLVIVLSVIIGVLVFLNNRYHSKIRYFSMYDSLTNAYNRGYGLEQLEKLFKSDNKKNFPISLCYIDINGLKQVNDNLGHEEGSNLIIHVVESVVEVIDSNSFIIRLGGDEFLIVLTGKSENEAEELWKQILEKYERINNESNLDYFISVSHGILELDKDELLNEVLNNVDQKMYAEKQMIKSTLKSVLKNK